MTFYYWLILALTLFWALLTARGRSRKKDAVYLGVAFLVLGGVSAFRYGIGIDYAYIYAPQYDSLLNTPGYSFGDTRFEPGFVALEKIVAFFSRDYQMLFVVTGLLVVGLFMLYYRLNSPNVFLSVFLFLTLSQFYCSMNFIRQTMAGIIALFALPFLKKRQFYFYLPVILLAALFHQSALIMIPFFFINLLPVTNKAVLAAFAGVTLVIYCNTHHILNFVTRYWYRGYQPDNEHVVTSFEFPFALGTLVVFVLLFLGRQHLCRRDRGNAAYLNYAFFALFFALMGTRHAILDRLSIYFILAAPVSLAILVEELATVEGRPAGVAQLFALSKRRGSQYVATIVLLVAGSLTLHHFALTKDHHGVVPYQTVFQQPFYREYRSWLQY